MNLLNERLIIKRIMYQWEAEPVPPKGRYSFKALWNIWNYYKNLWPGRMGKFLKIKKRSSCICHCTVEEGLVLVLYFSSLELPNHYFHILWLQPALKMWLCSIGPISIYSNYWLSKPVQKGSFRICLRFCKFPSS